MDLCPLDLASSLTELRGRLENERDRLDRRIAAVDAQIRALEAMPSVGGAPRRRPRGANRRRIAIFLRDYGAHSVAELSSLLQIPDSSVSAVLRRNQKHFCVDHLGR